ncbi:hypothetical protein B0A50_03523 [Salinomyces thailandicus]|uniref:LCCL domain-containing protein n=1 Tax=Salinomyces thailandicus TaxID=706561 RepID=A0A4U0U3A3_9PEZI|nr:hypothetical protein B0A50_03523 [Salinomyces thailandica]
MEMGPRSGRQDEEAGLGAAQHNSHARYHDDTPEDSDDEATIGPDAPLQGSGRPSGEFDGLRLGGPTASSWQDRISERIPPPVKHAWSKTVEWVKGPDPPRIFKIEPLFPKIQHAPLSLLDRYAPKRGQRVWLLALLYACWLFAFSMVLRASSFSASIPKYGTPVRMGCGSKYWSDGNGCRLNGDQCRPFANATLAFRCPAGCRLTEVLYPHAVGDQEVNYRPLVVGGPSKQQTGLEDELFNNAIYRGDSFICASAVHAGFINDAEGGCGVLSLVGEQPEFEASKKNGIASVGFSSYFPRSFGFLSGTRTGCQDLRWPAFGVSLFFTTLLSIFTTSPSVFFWSNWIILFFQTGLASDPPSLTNYYSLLSVAFGRFLPACFCGWVTYKYTVRRSLEGLTAQLEKTVLWLGPAWVGALNNMTFDKIPIQRLTPHDIKAQPGAVPALITIVLSIFFIALGQAWSFRVEGRMPRYLVIYGSFVLALLVCVAVPGLSLRIHHYILALLLLPGTCFQNRPSLLYQGLLVGLFINGIARWGFDSILQTPSELSQGAQKGTPLPAVSVLGLGSSNITFNLGPLPKWDSKTEMLFDGISVLVNDVERFRGYDDDRSYWDEGPGDGNYTWTWHRHHLGNRESLQETFNRSVPLLGEPDDLDAEAKKNLPEYFRFAYMAGSRVGDFTKAGRWTPDGEWIDMKPGPS